MKLVGRIALVTGSSSGIGRGVALAFASEGADVVINHPSPAEATAARAVAAEVEALGRRAVVVQADVSDEAQVAAMVAAAHAAFGRIDILVNNAGIAAAGAVHELAAAVWDRVIAVHLRGTFLVTKAVLPEMYARGTGRIINTASQLAYKGAPGFSAYTAAKGGILSFTRTTALELGARGITINCVAPGATLTPILQDIVPSYVFLASDEARHYQGQCLSPNGGDVFL